MNKIDFKQFLIFIFCFTLFISCKQSNEELLDKAYELSHQKKYIEAITINTEVIKRNKRLQLPFYNRGLEYIAVKNYNAAIEDFNTILKLQTNGREFISTLNSDLPIEEAKMQIPYYDALYQRARVKFYMDSINSSFKDFEVLVGANYEKSNCLLWEGVCYEKYNNNDKACEYFTLAKQSALTDVDKSDADDMILNYCEKK